MCESVAVIQSILVFLEIECSVSKGEIFITWEKESGVNNKILSGASIE